MSLAKKRIRKKSKGGQEKIALDRIGILFDLADKAALQGNLKLADEYVGNARNIGMRHNVRIPREHKRKFCKFCYRYLLPSITSIVRINSREKRVEIKCLNCGRIMFLPYSKKNEKQHR